MAIANDVYLQPKNEALCIIRDLGFEELGYWFMENAVISYNLFKSQKEANILYAFVVNDEVMYIGKSVQTLFKRMYLYKKCDNSQRTNRRNRANIIQCLEQEQTVRIYAFIPQDSMVYRGIPVNISAGLEDNLISLIKPSWNISGNHL